MREKALITEIITEIYSVFTSIFMAFVCFLGIFLVLNVIGVKAFDIWLVGGFSLIYGARFFIFGSPTIVSFITNKENVWPSAIIIFSRYIALLSIAIVFFVVVLLAEFSLYKVNPIIDIFVSLLISIVSLALLMSYLHSKRRHK